MRLTDEIADRLLPVEWPADDPSPQERHRLAEVAETFGDGSPRSRALAWQLFLARRLRESSAGSSAAVPRAIWDGAGTLPQPFAELACGFVPLDPATYHKPLIDAARQGTGWAFGAVLIDHGAPRPHPESADEADERPPAVVDLVELDPQLGGMPLVTITAYEVLHAPHLVNASATAWASRRPSGTVDHLLTAAHNLRWAGAGHGVRLAGGATAVTVACTPSPVDAALLRAPGAPLGLSPLAVEAVPAILDDVTFDGLSSGRVTGKLTMTTVVPGIAHPYLPQRIFLDTAGGPGDSGALVRSISTGRGLGIYTGVLTADGTPLVLAQALHQATTLLGADLWE